MGVMCQRTASAITINANRCARVSQYVKQMMSSAHHMSGSQLHVQMSVARIAALVDNALLPITVRQ